MKRSGFLAVSTSGTSTNSNVYKTGGFTRHRRHNCGLSKSLWSGQWSVVKKSSIAWISICRRLVEKKGAQRDRTHNEE